MSEEQRQQFPQDIKTMEERNQGRRDKWMMADYCGSIKRDLNNIEYDNQERKNSFHSFYDHEGFICC